MAGKLATQIEPAPLVACTISRNVQEFDLLIEDMEAELGEGWGDLSFEEAIPFLTQPDASELEFVAVAVDKKDEPLLRQVGEVIRQAKSVGVKVILIADGLGPMPLHDLLRDGANDFVPYPLPEGALAAAIARLDTVDPDQLAADVETEMPAQSQTDHRGSFVASPEGVITPAMEPTETEAVTRVVQDIAHEAPLAADQRPTAHGSGDRFPGDPTVIAVHGLAGGVGATTLATNLAWELATFDKHNAPRICVLDLDLQFGSVSTYFDLERRESIYEVLSDAQGMDQQAFNQSLLPYRNMVDVFTAPTDILPLDLLVPQDLKALIKLAKDSHDFVIIDMPTTVVAWTETVLAEADVYFAVTQLDLRSAQNVLRLTSALEAEKLPADKVSYVLNRGPRDISGKGRVKRMADNLGIDFRFILQDGGDAISEANDEGVPLAELHAKLPFRKELTAMAERILEAAQAENFDLSQATKPKGRSFFGFGR